MSDAKLLRIILAELSSAAKQSGVHHENISLWSVGKMIGGYNKVRISECHVTCAAITEFRRRGAKMEADGICPGDAI